MTATWVTTFVMTAAGVLGSALLLMFPPVVGHAGEAAESTRTIDVTLSRYAFSPGQIELRLGERVRLNVVSVDGAHGFQVDAIGLDVRVPTRGRTVTVTVTPKVPGRFQIICSEYCGSGHSRMKAWLIVTPRR